jgi:uncharacterized protein YukE
MANYSVNLVGMQDVEDELTRLTGELDRSLSELQTKVQAFTAANAGQAPDTYATAQQLWSQGQHDMHEALKGGQLRLRDITANYVMGDNRGAAVFGG